MRRYKCDTRRAQLLKRECYPIMTEIEYDFKTRLPIPGILPGVVGLTCTNSPKPRSDRGLHSI
jgi:hypothetical protein